MSAGEVLTQEEVEEVLGLMTHNEKETPMSHEDWMDQDELDAMKAMFASESATVAPPVKTAPPVVSRTDGYITVDIPPLPIPTPAKVCQWVAKIYQWAWDRQIPSIFLCVSIGFVAGLCSRQHNTTEPPPNPVVVPEVVPKVETLENFVTRESKVLTADQRKKLIGITETILSSNYYTPSALREDFHFRRVQAGLHDSPGFNAFWKNWADKVTELKVEESVESMQDVYTSLLHGLQLPGEPVGAFSIFYPDQPHVHDGADEPVPPDIKPVQPPPVQDSPPVQRQRPFRRIATF
jgi:hypothetical protein